METIMLSSTRGIILFSLFFFNFTTTFVWSYERDQGDLDKEHVQDADKFRKTYFLNEEQDLDLKKIRHMIARLQKERQEIANNSYESRLIEKIDWRNISRGLPGRFHGDFHFENILLHQ